MAEVSKFLETSNFGKNSVVLDRDIQKYQEYVDKQLSIRLKSLHEAEKREKEIQQQIENFKLARSLATSEAEQKELEGKLQKSLESYEEVYNKRVELEKQAALEKIKIEEEALRYSTSLAESKYKKLNIRERRAYNKKVEEEIKAELDKFSLIEAVHESSLSTLKSMEDNATGEEKKRIQERIAAEEAEFAKRSEHNQELLKQYEIAKKTNQGFNQATLHKGISGLNKITNGKVNLNTADRDAAWQDAGNKAVTSVKTSADILNECFELTKKIGLANLKNDKESAKNLKNELKAKQAVLQAALKGDSQRLEQLKEQGTITEEQMKALEGLKENGGEAIKQLGADLAAETLDGVARGLDNLSSQIFDKAMDSKEINVILDDIFGSQARMISRLQGASVKWRDTVDDVSDTIGMSGLVSKKSVINQMEKLVDSGIAYNLELRAFLAETSQQIASTFDAFDSSLLRIIRLQQADTTAARVGLETTLTKLFNDFFSDSSYLSTASDSVTQAILDSSALMGKEESLTYEYNVQKWLGSLYSIGASSDVVQKIAQGINYLGTGNVQALNNDAGLQTLLSMAAARAGGRSYSDILLTGLTSDDTNKLLKAMVEYLAEIADTSTNAVTRSAYADLFGMTVTDLATFSSLKTEEIDSLYKSTVSYNALLKETESELDALSSRSNMAAMLNTAIDNTITGVATTIGSTAFTYATWQALSLLKTYVGEIKIPGIIGFGTGISSGLDLLNLAQTGMMGLSLIAEVATGIGSMFNGGPTKLSNWDFEESTTRGSGLSVLNIGSTTETSLSAKLGVGSVSTEDIESTSMQSGADSAEKASKKGTTSEEIEAQKDQMQELVDAICGDSTPTVLSLLQEIDDRLDPGRVFYTAIAGVLSADQASRLTNLSTQVSVAAATAVNSIEGTDSKASGATAATATSTSTTTNGGVSGVTGYDENWSDEAKARYNQYVAELTPDSLGEVISMAVEQALRNIGNMPVDVKSMPGGSY